MSFFPNDDYLDGRDPLVKRHHDSLKATKPQYIESEPSGIVPYEDLQRSPSPWTGEFQYSFDKGTLDICVRENAYSRAQTLAVVTLRNDINSRGEKVIFVSLQLPAKEEEQ